MSGYVIVVGGGPAGMIAAAECAKAGARVLLIERNEKLGKKLYLTGKGRCNFTNTAAGELFFNNIMRNPKFLYSAFKAFDNTASIRLFEEWGVPGKVERGGRVFPLSDKSSDCIKALREHLARNAVQVALGEDVKTILVKEGRIAGCRTDHADYPADAIILAAGGAVYPATGSDGSGYELARQCGHSVTDIFPALVPMETAESWPAKLAGLSLRNVTLSAYNGNDAVYQELGEMLFTHFGVSGPLVLSASSCIDPQRPTRLSIDLKPGLSSEQLTRRMQRDFDAGPKKRFQNSLDGLMPSALAQVVAGLAGIDANKTSAEITKAERLQLVELLKGLPLQITGLRSLGEAIITRGGVRTGEINPSTMESKLVRGLYFAGELIDLDARTGGFNLQIAFSTGYLAGTCAGEALQTSEGI